MDIVGKSLGRYHIVEQLGSGGMAIVFKAFDTSLEREVAIKVIRVETEQEEEFLKRFKREAKALAKLDHPHILQILDYGEQEGLPYLVMSYLPGGTLKQQMGKKLSYQKAAQLLAPIGRALEYAHKEGIIHRDVKPANILISKNGNPMLSDFGIAKMLDAKEMTQLTGTGIIGTPDYMAPEQWLGVTNAQSDIYALGIIFYEMVTGRKPYTADTPAAVFLKHREDPLPRPKDFVPDLPDAVEQVLFKAMAKEPADRYQDMGAFASALEGLAYTQHPPIVEPVATSPDSISSPGTLQFDDTGIKAAAAEKVEEAQKQVQTKTGLSNSWKTASALFIVGGFAVVACVLLALILIFSQTGQNLLSKGQPMTPSETSVEKQVSETTQKTAEEQSHSEDTETNPQVTELPQTLPGGEPFEEIDGLPDDIPVLKENNGDLMIQKGSDTDVFLFTSPLEYEQVANFFEQEMAANSWELINRTQISADNTTVLMYQKEERTVTISTSEVNDVVWVNIMLIKNYNTD